MIELKYRVELESDEDLMEAVRQVNRYMTGIQTYLERRPDRHGEIEFPRGFLRNTLFYRQQLPFIRNEYLLRNLTYNMMLIDTLYWLLIRTDIAGVARSMLIKTCLIGHGAIAETVTIHISENLVGKRNPFDKRCDKLVDLGYLTLQVVEELKWLWNKRRGIHIFEMRSPEIDRYTDDDFVRAEETVNRLLVELKNTLHK